jgi:hypothetical protein
MINLRDILREQDRNLHAALETSWTIAQSDWIPTLIMESESYSGLPHLLAVENYMNQIAEACRPIWSKEGLVPFDFNPLELYLLLCAALFHDIGRGRPDNREPKPEHGEISADILREHWARLGIVNERVAHELGHICKFHTEKCGWERNDVARIHPWGTIHTQAIASLLVLADDLDTAYNRAVPQYMKNPDHIIDDVKEIDFGKMNHLLTKGYYRDFISAVDLDPKSNLIKTVLSSDRLPGYKIKGNEDGFGKNCAPKWIDKVYDSETPSEFDTAGYFFSFLEVARSEIDAELLEIFAQQYSNAKNYARNELVRKVKIPKGNEFKSFEYNLQLWNWQLGNKTGMPYDKDDRDIENLKIVIKLIKNTVECISKEIGGTRKVELNKGIVDKLFQIFGTTCWFAYYYVDARNKILKKEKQHGKDATEEDLNELDRLWMNKRGSPSKLFLENDTNMSEKKLYEDYGNYKENLSRITVLKPKIETHKYIVDLSCAHRFMIMCLQYLSYVEMDTILDDKKRPCEKTQFRILSRSVEEFRENLLAIFQCYLINTRKLTYDETDIDCRYLKYSEKPFQAEVKPTEVKPDKFKNVLEELYDIVRYSSESGDIGDIDDHSKYLIDDLSRQVASYRNSRKQHKIKTVDFKLASSMIFMEWLSKDIKSKNKNLKRISDGLGKLNIPLTAWLIEYNNHLFDADWNLCLEPILDINLMEKMLDKIFEITRMLHVEDSYFKWETLAAAVSDHKLNRVKTGAERLASLIWIYQNLQEINQEISNEKNKNPRYKFGENDQFTWHYGDVLMADLRYKRKHASNNNQTVVCKLDTAHSMWKLNLSDCKNHDYEENLRRFLKGCVVPRQEKRK